MKNFCICLIALLFTGMLLQNTISGQGPGSYKIVEDGGTGVFCAIMYTDTTLLTHTIVRPKDLSMFGTNNKLPIIALGNGGCANSPEGHINFLIDISRIAVSGMSCGGLQALEVAPDPRFTTTIICNSGIIGNPGGGLPCMPAFTINGMES